MLEENEEIIVEELDENLVVEDDYDEIIIEEDTEEEVLIEDNNTLTFKKEADVAVKTSIVKDISVTNIFRGINNFLANDYLFLVVTVFVYMFLKKDKLSKREFSSDKIRFSALMMFFIIMAISLPMQFKNGMFYYLYLIIAFVFFAELKKSYKRMKFDEAIKDSFNITKEEKKSGDFNSIVRTIIENIKNEKGEK